MCKTLWETVTRIEKLILMLLMSIATATNHQIRSIHEQAAGQQEPKDVDSFLLSKWRFLWLRE
jgi:hypothetical protein